MELPQSFPCKSNCLLSFSLKEPIVPDIYRFSYIAEVAPPSIRGRLVGFYEIGSQGAQMCGFWVNYAVNRTISSSSKSIMLQNPDM